VAVAKEVAEPFIEELKKAIIKQVGEEPHNNEEYPKLITHRAYEAIEAEANEYKDRILLVVKAILKLINIHQRLSIQ
jgi:aldehyde dehydrogenase (NAD+)